VTVLSEGKLGQQGSPSCAAKNALPPWRRRMWWGGGLAAAAALVLAVLQRWGVLAQRAPGGGPRCESRRRPLRAAGCAVPQQGDAWSPGCAPGASGGGQRQSEGPEKGRHDVPCRMGTRGWRRARARAPSMRRAQQGRTRRIRSARHQCDISIRGLLQALVGVGTDHIE
jgi:hypothetical protein